MAARGGVDNREPESEKKLVTKLLTFLNEPSLWELAELLLDRGLVEVVPLDTASNTAVQRSTTRLPPAVPVTPETPTTMPLTEKQFAEGMVSRLSPKARQAAQQQGSQATTLIIRNLSLSLSDQAVARKWFDSWCGFEDQYDFFLFFHGKRNACVSSGDIFEPPQGPGYFFVNFTSPESAHCCKDRIHGKVFEGSLLDVAVSRKQGREELLQHFEGLVTPWLG